MERLRVAWLRVVLLAAVAGNVAPSLGREGIRLAQAPAWRAQPRGSGHEAPDPTPVPTPPAPTPPSEPSHGHPHRDDGRNSVYVIPYDPYWPYWGYPGIWYDPWSIGWSRTGILAPELVDPFYGLIPEWGPRAGTAFRPSPSQITPKQEKVPRGSNASALALARRLMGFGDRHFQDRNYSAAWQRYQDAAEAAPGLAGPYLGQGVVFVATGAYDRAAKAFQRALQTPFQPSEPLPKLERLYGERQADKRNHLNALAAAALEDPGNGELLFVLGVFLYLDGQQDRAKPFLQRAAQLGGVEMARIKNLF